MYQNYTPLNLPNQNITNTQKNQFHFQNQDKPGIFKRIILIVVILVFLGFSAIAGGIVLAGYTDINIPLINQKQRSAIKVYLASLPAIPKTEEMIALAIIDKAKSIKSFDVNVSSNSDISNMGQVGSLGAEIDTQNHFSFKNNIISAQGKAKFNLKAIATNFVIEGEYILIGSDIYLKLTYLPIDKIFKTAEMFDFRIQSEELTMYQTLYNKIKDRWIKITPESLNSEAARELQKQQTEETFSYLYKNNVDLLIDDKYKIDFSKNNDLYIFKIVLTGKDFFDIIKQSLYEKGQLLTQVDLKEVKLIESVIDKITITIEADQNYYVKKASTIINLNFSKLGKNWATTSDLNQLFSIPGGIDISTVSTFDNFNSDKNIQKPQSVSIETLIQEIQLEFLESYQRRGANSQTVLQNQSNFNKTKDTIAYELISLVNNYYRQNNKYPLNLNEINPEYAKNVYTSGVIYQTNETRTTYLIYYKNTDSQSYTLIKNGRVISRNLDSAGLNEELNKENLNVLGAFTHRLNDIIQQN